MVTRRTHRRAERGANYTGRAPKVPLNQAQTNRPGSIDCPDCPSKAGEECVSATGKRVAAHRSRQRLAARLLNAQRERANEVTPPGPLQA